MTIVLSRPAMAADAPADVGFWTKADKDSLWIVFGRNGLSAYDRWC